MYQINDTSTFASLIETIEIEKLYKNKEKSYLNLETTLS